MYNLFFISGKIRKVIFVTFSSIKNNIVFYIIREGIALLFPTVYKPFSIKQKYCTVTNVLTN